MMIQFSILEHMKIVLCNFQCRKINRRFFLHPKNKCLQQTYSFKVRWYIIFLLIIFSFAIFLVSAEDKKINVRVNVINSGYSENISSDSNSPISGEAIKVDKETTVKPNEISSFFSNSLKKLYSYKPDYSWIVFFILIGLILVLIVIYKFKDSFFRKKDI